MKTSDRSEARDRLHCRALGPEVGDEATRVHHAHRRRGAAWLLQQM